MDNQLDSGNRASIDEVRQFWDERPCNIRHSKLEIGSKAYFDEVEHRKYFVEPHIPEFAQFDRWAGRRVLEVGCGIGTDALNFALSGADYVGVELSRNSLELAVQRFGVYDMQGRFLNANAEELASELEGEQFDLVYSFGVLHHTPNPGEAIAQIRQLIAPDGELRLMLYAKNSWKAIMIDAGFDQAEAQFGVPIADTFTPEEVRTLMEKSGFRVETCTQDHIFPYVVEKYINHEYEKQPWIKAMPDEMFAAIEKALGWHLLIVAKPH